MEHQKLWIRWRRINNHIVNVYLDVGAYLISQAVLHHPLVSCTHIFKAEVHDLITVHSAWCNECYFFFMFHL
jgi:hypothetical protein